MKRDIHIDFAWYCWWRFCSHRIKPTSILDIIPKQKDGSFVGFVMKENFHSYTFRQAYNICLLLWRRSCVCFQKLHSHRLVFCNKGKHIEMGIVLHKQQFNRLNENKGKLRIYEQWEREKRTHRYIYIWHTSLKLWHIRWISTNSRVPSTYSDAQTHTELKVNGRSNVYMQPFVRIVLIINENFLFQLSLQFSTYIDEARIVRNDSRELIVFLNAIHNSLSASHSKILSL